MNYQQVFDKVFIHLLTQNAKSFSFADDTVICSYRGEHGMKCAIGCLITDDAYNPEMENMSVYMMQVFDALQDSGIDISSSDDEKFLEKLQYIHDNFHCSCWRAELFKLSREYNLTIPELTKETK